MADSFNFELVSPERLLVSGSVSEVVIPATEGEMTVMANHAPTMTTIKPGIVTVKTADGKVKDLTSHQRFTYAGPTTLSWEQVKGDAKSITGSWQLKDLGDGRTHATFALEVDPGRVLGMAIRGPVEAALRALLVNPRAGELKKRAEA